MPLFRAEIWPSMLAGPRSKDTLSGVFMDILTLNHTEPDSVAPQWHLHPPRRHRRESQALARISHTWGVNRHEMGGLRGACEAGGGVAMRRQESAKRPHRREEGSVVGVDGGCALSSSYQAAAFLNRAWARLNSS